MKYIHKKTNLPVISISYFGHIADNVDQTRDNNLNRQVEHKIEVFDAIIPQNVNILLAGHSIGGYMTVELLRRLKTHRKVEQSFLLMPAIQHLASSTNGLVFNQLFKLKYIVFAFVYMLSTFVNRKVAHYMLDKFLKTFFGAPDCFTRGTLEIINWKVIRNVIELAQDEFDKVKERDDETIRENINNLTFIYAEQDGWATKHHYDDLRSTYPDGDIKYFEKVWHVFYLDKTSSEQVADVLIQRIQNKRDINLNLK